MKILILFNWPPAKDSARVSFCSSIDDLKYEFKVGIVKKNKIYWLRSEWVESEEINDLKFNIEINKKIIINKKEKESQEISTNTWDISREWPIEASGASSTERPWTF